MDTKTNICEFCKKEFVSKSNLLSHQRTAKYCLEIQGKNMEDFKCKYCDKIFTTSHNLNEHYNSCKVKKEEDKKLSEKKTQLEYDNKIKTLQLEHQKELDILNTLISQKEKEHKDCIFEKDKEHKKEIDILNKTIYENEKIIDKLEKKLETYEKRLFEIASRPTTNHNINQD